MCKMLFINIYIYDINVYYIYLYIRLLYALFFNRMFSQIYIYICEKYLEEVLTRTIRMYKNYYKKTYIVFL